MGTHVSTSTLEAGLDLALDPGIRRYVLALNEAGIETFESCEGGSGHAFTEPTIRFYGGIGEGYKAFGIAKDLGLPVYRLNLSYPVTDGLLTGPWWEMIFTTKDGD